MSLSSRAGIRALVLVIATALLAAALTVAGQVTGRDTATAAVTGAGYSGITPYGGYLGNYIAPDGYRVYCMDSTWDWPSGATGAGTLVTSLEFAWGAPVHGSYIEKMNYVLTRFGQTDDPTQAAAVSAFIYAYTSTWARYNGVGYAAGAHYIAGNAAVQGVYDTIWADAEANYHGTPGSATVDIVMANSLDGYVEVTTSPASATGTLTLTDAVAAGTGETTVAVTNGSIVPIRGVPAADASTYQIAASASFTAASGANQDITIYYTGSQQRTLRGGTPGTTSFVASDETDELPLTFAPVVRTAVASTFVDAGDPFVDTVSASVAESSAAWRAGTAIIASGTLYGPFDEQPEVATVAPTGSPVVGTETLTLTGPGEYRSAGTLTAPTAGFYTWVWSIDAAAQATAVAAQLPDDYLFADQFGLVAETHVVPIDLAVRSDVSVAETSLGGSVGDTLTVALASGTWLSVDGDPVDAVFEGTAYFVAGDSAPAASDTVPEGAVVLGTATITAEAPGTYLASATVTAPAATAGWITWVWSLSPASDWASYFTPWSDGFGAPSETARVLPPTVSTLAQSAVAIGDPVHDTATVGGTLPAQSPSLIFRAYLQEDASTPTCTPETLVFESAPVVVTALGRWDSPVTRFEEYGTYFWVETLVSQDGQVIHSGECGLPDETTLVAPGEVVTLATPVSQVGEASHDTAMVSGMVPQGATLQFEAFHQQSVDGPLCDESNVVFSSVAIPAPGAGQYTSPSTQFDEPGTYYWVETLLDRDGEPLHIGACGAEGETTNVATPALASTGSSGIPFGAGVVGAGLLGGGGILLLVALLVRRGRRHVR